MDIGGIYAGKPDASDEIRERGYEEFANNYIKPSGVDIERLASTKYGTPFFIMGDKGTGKTALLYFLSNYIRKIDESACSSFVYFESEYTQVQRQRFNKISQTISTSLQIESSVASVGEKVECDFTYIWKWQFYQKIITDNEQFNDGLFILDDKWKKFVDEINKISKTINKTQMRIPAKISVSAVQNPQLGTVSSGLGIEPVDFSQRNFNITKGYKEFVKIIDRADQLVGKLTRTDIPYYVFIDELEAYRGENETFYRDLRLIRDLLFTVKRMNDIFGDGTKFLCSVRLEILNAINRFIQSKQVHKIMQGYDERLTWEYTNTNSFNHPIIGVLLRRIQNAEEKEKGYPVDEKDIIRRWFVANVYNTHICTYILDNTWHKPRDIVRLLLAAQSKNSRKFSIFNQNTFETFMPVYSEQCLVEVREEMCALYTPEEIENIFGCLQGFKVIFSYDEIRNRAQRLYPDSTFAKNTNAVLTDMYRIGVIGNTCNGNTRWEYKGQYKLYIDKPWKIIIHRSLRIALSVSVRGDRRFNRSGKNRSEEHEERKIYQVEIKDIKYRYLLVTFDKDGCICKGYISMNKCGIQGVKEGELGEYFSKGAILNANLIEYDRYNRNWKMHTVNDSFSI